MSDYESRIKEEIRIIVKDKLPSFGNRKLKDGVVDSMEKLLRRF